MPQSPYHFYQQDTLDTFVLVFWNKVQKKDVDSLDDFANVVEQSAYVNKSQLVGKTDD